MQENNLAQNMDSQNLMYSEAMTKQIKRQRPKMGEHLAMLRNRAGLSQYELAELLGVPQSNVAFWELGNKPPRSEVLPNMAKILGVRVDTILHPNGENIKESGPRGKVRQAFENVSRLPKKQQEKIVEFVSAFVNQYQSKQQ